MPTSNIDSNISLFVSAENFDFTVSANFARAVSFNVWRKHVYRMLS
jgi:hypothetical protein